ncbi:MAG: Murein DD-endopeptidase MepM [Betaproteobacteria bacterium ADurb.Bin341]|nr:MAG: Murein DD-endopeptidase MepM [Betaproteobacteria bacterium ADurb.Bin341]
MQENGILTQAHHERRKRQQWMVGSIGVLATLGMAAAIAIATPGKNTTPVLETIVQDLALDQAQIVSMEGASFLREERIQRGDTLGTLLVRLGIQDHRATQFLRTNPSARTIHRQLAPNKTVVAETSVQGELRRLVFPLNGGDTALIVERRGETFAASEQALRFEKRILVKSAEIRHSLFGATDASDIPDSVATQLADIFAGDIDFHRDLRKGDRFSVVYEMNYLRGQATRTGRILAAEFINNGKILQAFYFEHEGRGGYYGADGKSLKKAFLRAPLEFTRISSGFGMRTHPILLDRRPHKGIDYAAPTGTKVRAVGDGVVEFVGKRGGYGNLVILRHHGPYSTAYGHLNGFASGLKKGSRVSQGDTIGFVGATGWATGPHLHYEFRVNHQQVNPLSVTLPTAPPLSTAQMPHFRTLVHHLMPQIELVRQTRLAASN